MLFRMSYAIIHLLVPFADKVFYDCAKIEFHVL